MAVHIEILGKFNPARVIWDHKWSQYSYLDLLVLLEANGIWVLLLISHQICDYYICSTNNIIYMGVGVGGPNEDKF